MEGLTTDHIIRRQADEIERLRNVVKAQLSALNHWRKEFDREYGREKSNQAVEDVPVKEFQCLRSYFNENREIASKEIGKILGVVLFEECGVWCSAGMTFKVKFVDEMK